LYTVKAWATPAQGVKTGPAWGGWVVGGGGVVCFVPWYLEKKRFKSQICPHLEDLPYKKNRQNYYYCSLSSYRVSVFKMNFEFHQPIRGIIVAIK